MNKYLLAFIPVISMVFPTPVSGNAKFDEINDRIDEVIAMYGDWNVTADVTETYGPDSSERIVKLEKDDPEYARMILIEGAAEAGVSRVAISICRTPLESYDEQLYGHGVETTKCRHASSLTDIVSEIIQ